MATWKATFKTNRRGDFTGHRASLEYSYKSRDSGTLKALVSQVLEKRGNFSFDLPLTELTGTADLYLSAPSGQIIFRQAIPAQRLKATTTFAADPAGAMSTEGIAADAPPRRLTGVVVNEDGSAVTASGDVTIWAKPLDGTSVGIVAVAVTAANGYFWTAYPSGAYAEAYATFSRGDFTSRQTEIGLREDGAFPETVFLPVSFADVGAGVTAGEAACDCPTETPRSPDPEDLVAAPDVFSDDLGGGRCVDFTRPDRTIEEFIYLHVLRVTEPDITGTRSGTDGDYFKVTTKTADYLARAILADPRIRGIYSKAQKAVADRNVEGSVEAKLFRYIRAELGLPPGKFQAAKGLISEIARSLVAADLMLPAAYFERRMRDGSTLTLQSLVSASAAANSRIAAEKIAAGESSAPGRAPVASDNQINWEGDPTYFQAVSVARGHILKFRQVWRADGYSLGDLVYSLALAPCEKRKIAIIDWERREKARRAEEEGISESLVAEISRNRAIAETIDATLHESMRGFSIAGTAGHGSGGGGAGSYGMFTGVVGVGGGWGVGGSYAQNEGNRELAAQTQQDIRDKTLQSASAVRNRLATTVVEVSQSETVQLETRAVANHNHCHAMTMEYFEVLRHFQVSQELDSVQECLFIPLPMSPFDGDKALEWREQLSRLLIDRRLRGGFAALKRLHQAEQSPAPEPGGEQVSAIEGYADLEFHLNPPTDTEGMSWKEKAWNSYAMAVGRTSLENTFKDLLKDFKDDPSLWETRIVPFIVEHIIDAFNRLTVVDDDGNWRGAGVQMEFATLQSKEAPLVANALGGYVSGNPVRVRFTPSATPVDVTLAEIKALRIINSIAYPYGSFVKVRKAAFYAITDSGRIPLAPERDVNDKVGAGDDVYVPVAAGDAEAVVQAEQDDGLAEALLRHLNANLEYYHKALWARMDPNRRYMLLDGFVAPNSGGRSIASVVDNEIIAIVGNSLVMPVSGSLSPDASPVDADGNPVDLVDVYRPESAPPRMRVSLPTGGVFAEAVLGACNSCEVKDDTRFWRWSEEPCPDDAPDIQPIGGESRRADPGNLTTQAMPPPMVNIQNAPSLPDPTGLASALQTIAQSDAFRDLTGLTANQQNAMTAMAKSLETAQHFGSEAASMWKTMSGGSQADRYNLIDKAVGEGYLSQEQAGGLMRDMLDTSPSAAMTVDDVGNLIDRAGQHGASASFDDGNGRRTHVDASGAFENRRFKASDTDEGPVLETVGNTPDTRAFHPAERGVPEHLRTEDMSDGGAAMSVQLANHIHTGAAIEYSWTIDPPDAAIIEGAPDNEARKTVKPLRPGIAELTVAAREQNESGAPGPVLAETNMTLSVPQYVVVSDNPGVFDPVWQEVSNDTDRNRYPIDFETFGHFRMFLDKIGLTQEQDREAVFHTMKAVVDGVLEDANVRVVWEPLGESLPRQFLSDQIVQTSNVAPKQMFIQVALLYVDILNPGVLGKTIAPVRYGTPHETADLEAPIAWALAGPDHHGEQIYVSPGSMVYGEDDIRALMTTIGDPAVDEGSFLLYKSKLDDFHEQIVDRTLFLELRDTFLAASDPADKLRLKDLLILAFGNLAGGILAHEIGHALMGTEPWFIGRDGHEFNLPASTLMTTGVGHTFTTTTGIVINDRDAWPAQGSYDITDLMSEGPRRKRLLQLSGRSRRWLERWHPVAPE